MESMILQVILFPAFAGIAALVLRDDRPKMVAFISLLATFISLGMAAMIFGNNAEFIVPWGPIGFTFHLKAYAFSHFILLAACGFAAAVSLYSLPFIKAPQKVSQYYGYLLITLGLTNGVALAGNLVTLLFFWEALLLTLYGMIAIGSPDAYKTAIKAFIISGVADLCLIVGIALTITLAGTGTMTDIHLQTTGLAGLAFVLMMIGAIAKGGSMPFHSWIPDAALQAPLPFMALLPAALEKLLGLYLLTRISMNFFSVTPESWASYLMMIIGSITIVLAVLMALIQKDYKKLLSFHAISQFGYMILGVGTAIPAGIVGGLFHMINNALYKCGLFLTGGAVEKEAGTTDLEKLGGLRKIMPITFICFVITAVSISGVPPFNGFFSKELIYDAALERHWIFYLAAIVGSFLTAASFLKLGHAAWCGPVKNTRAKKEVPWSMLAPMITIAFLCVLFGVANPLPLKFLIEPSLGETYLQGKSFAGFHMNLLLVGGTLLVLTLAVLNHLFGVKRTGKGVGAVDHIHYAPGFHTMYDLAEKRRLDPYEWGMTLVQGISRFGYWIDRGTDFIYNKLVTGSAHGVAKGFSKAHTGHYAFYLLWALVGIALVAAYVLVIPV